MDRFRATTPADFDDIHALHRRAEIHDGIPIATPRREWDEWLDDPHVDMAEDTRVAESDGQIVAWARVWHQPAAEGDARAYLFGTVDPAHRGRGIGSALLAWEIARGEALVGRAAPGQPRIVCAQAYDYQHDAARLYARHGLNPARYNDELLRDLETLPGTAEVPGVAITPWDPARSEEARIVRNESFMDHWGTSPRDPATWEHMLHSVGSRLDLSFLAIERNQVVGICRNAHFPDDEAITGRRDGWIFQLGVLRSHRKRGIASALIVRSLHAFRLTGFTHSALGVDSANPTGAYQLYERLGYRPMQRSVVYQRPA